MDTNLLMKYACTITRPVERIMQTNKSPLQYDVFLIGCLYLLLVDSYTVIVRAN